MLVGIGGFVNPLVSVVTVGESNLVIPASLSEFEFGGKHQVKVDGICSVINLVHFNPLRIPIAELGLVAGDEHIAVEPRTR